MVTLSSNHPSRAPSLPAPIPQTPPPTPSQAAAQNTFAVVPSTAQLRTALGASAGFAAGGLVGGTLGALGVPVAGLEMAEAGTAIMVGGPALAFVTTLANAHAAGVPVWMSVPGACFVGACMVPAGGLLTLGGLVWMAASPVVAPWFGVVGGTAGAVSGALAGARLAQP